MVMKNMTESQQLLIEQTLSQAKKAMKHGNTAIAFQLLNTALHQQPDHLVAKKGICQLQKMITKNQQYR